MDAFLARVRRNAEVHDIVGVALERIGTGNREQLKVRARLLILRGECNGAPTTLPRNTLAMIQNADEFWRD